MKARIISIQEVDGLFRVHWKSTNGLRYARDFPTLEAAKTFAEFKVAGGKTIAG